MNNFPTLIEYLDKYLDIDIDPEDGAAYINETIAERTIHAIGVYKPAPSLCHFTECGEDGKPIEEPKEPKMIDYISVAEFNGAFDHCTKMRKEWQAAQKRVLFDGWTYENRGNSLSLYGPKNPLGHDTWIPCAFGVPQLASRSIAAFAHSHNGVLFPTDSAAQLLNLPKK